MAQKTLALCIQAQKILKSLDTLTVIMEAAQMIGREHMGTHFILVQVLFHGLQRNQPIVTLSSAELEYVAATSAACQAVWMRRVLKGLSRNHEEPTTIFCDNNSAIALSKNHVFHKKTTHIDIRFHFIRELVNNKEICLEFCRFEDQLADIFTKPLAKETFQYLCSYLGMTSSPQ